MTSDPAPAPTQERPSLPGSNGPYRARTEDAYPGVPQRAARGILLGALLGVPLWAGILLLLRRLLGG